MTRSFTISNNVMLSVSFFKCYDECHHAICGCAESYYAEGHCVIMLNVVIPSVVASFERGVFEVIYHLSKEMIVTS
jgi:hypothetical protein